MIQNRVLALLLLLILIPIGFLLIFRSSLPFLNPLRRDAIPSGAYVVPWMTSTESIASLYATPPQAQPWNLTAAMRGSLTLDITFNIALPNGTRIVHSTIFLGHDLNLLYIGGIFRGMYSNPNSHTNPDGSYDVPPNYLKMLVDVNNDGVLKAPESGSDPVVFVPCLFDPSRCGLGSGGWGSIDTFPGYDDLAWVNYVPEYRHGGFDLTSHICLQPSTLAGIATEYNYSSGDLVIVFAKRLSQPNSCADGLQMRSEERWVVGFLFELGYAKEAPLSDYVSGWPITAYPYLSTDSSSWPKLAIDLANQHL